jgi:hypothetical protein
VRRTRFPRGRRAGVARASRGRRAGVARASRGRRAGVARVAERVSVEVRRVFRARRRAGCRGAEMLPLRALVCAGLLAASVRLSNSEPGRGVVVGSDEASLVNSSLSGLTQARWLLGRSEWQAEGVAVRVLRERDWCEFGQRLSAFVAAGGSRYDYVDTILEREYGGKLVLFIGEDQIWCGPKVTLSSDGKERHWYRVLICRYALGYLQLKPSQTDVGFFTHWQPGNWWAEYDVSLECAPRPRIFCPNNCAIHRRQPCPG